MKNWIFCLVLCLLPALAFAEFDVKVGDMYYLNDGTPSIVISVSEDRMEITIDTELYKKREASKKTQEILEAWKTREWEEKLLREREIWAFERIAEELAR